VARLRGHLSVVSACEMSCTGERLSERVGLQLFSRRHALGYWPKSATKCGIEQAVIDAINPHGNPSLADAREHRLTERKVEQLSPEPGRKDRLVRGIGWRPSSVDGGHLKLTVDQEVGGSSPPSCTKTWLRKLAKSPTMMSGQSTTTTCRRPGAKLKESQPRRLRSDGRSDQNYGFAPSTAITLYFAYFSPILRAASYSGE
jgi:hypothetical protein